MARAGLKWRPDGRAGRRSRRVAALGPVVALVVAATAGPVGAAPPPIELQPAINSATGSTLGPGPGAKTTTTADLNTDGRLDVVITDVATSTPIAMLNQGGGRFGPPKRLPFGSGALSIDSGDFNADGRPDVVGRSGFDVSLWTGRGDGSFNAAQSTFVAGNAQPAITVVDVDSDGRPDVVTTAAAGIQVLRGNGTGLVSGPTTSAFGLLADVESANLNGDSRPDLVVVDATPFLQRTRTFFGVGDGTFREAGAGSTGLGPEDAAVGDLNHDGIDDVVTSDSFSVIGLPPRFSITVLISNGRGGFAPPVTHPTASGPVSGAIGDLNRDGHPDVVISGVAGNKIALYANDGTGTLTAAGSLTVASAPQTPVIADLNGDALSDIGVPGVMDLSVLLNGSTGT